MASTKAPASSRRRDVADPPPLVPEVEAAYRELASRLARAIELEEEEDRLRALLDANEAASQATYAEIREARRALTLAILGEAPRPLPTLAEWFYSVRPLWEVRSGRRIFALLVGKDANQPIREEEIPGCVTLTVIEA